MFKKLKWLILPLLLSALESHATFSVPDRPHEISSRISSPTSHPTFAHFALFVVSSSSDLPSTPVNDSSSYLCVARRSLDLQTFRPLTFDSSSEDGYWAFTCQSVDGSTLRFENGENRLISAVPVTPTNGAKKIEFVSDYMGRRSRNIVSEYTNSAWSVVSTNHFLYDGWLLVREQSAVASGGGGNLTNYYAHGLDLSGTLQGAGGIGGLLSWTRSSDTNTFLYCFDANGNVGQVLDASDGSMAAAYEYSAYGETITETGSECTNNIFMFSTKPYDREFGCYSYIFRPYSPTLGRWLRRDPVQEFSGLNMVLFVGNCPCCALDPLGLWEYEKVLEILCGSSSGRKALFLLDEENVSVYRVDSIKAWERKWDSEKNRWGDWQLAKGSTVGITERKPDMKNGKTTHEFGVYVVSSLSDWAAAITLVHESTHVNLKGEIAAHIAEAEFALENREANESVMSLIPPSFVKDGKVDTDAIKSYIKKVYPNRPEGERWEEKFEYGDSPPKRVGPWTCCPLSPDVVTDYNIPF